MELRKDGSLVSITTVFLASEYAEGWYWAWAVEFGENQYTLT